MYEHTGTGSSASIKKNTAQHEIELLIDRLLKEELIDLHLAADLLGSQFKVLRYCSSITNDIVHAK